MQGTAGNVIPPPEFLQRAQDIAREFGAVFIADEMITGFGRTGRWFACERSGVTPDAITLGKGFGSGFPISGVVAKHELAQAKPWANPSGSSSSYGGNPLAAAAALASIRTLQRENLRYLHPHQLWGNHLSLILIYLLYGFRFTDMGPFRAIRYDALMKLGIKDPTWGWNAEMQIKAIQAGLRIKEVAVSYRERIGRSKISGTVWGSLAAGSRILYTILRNWRPAVPAR